MKDFGMNDFMNRLGLMERLETVVCSTRNLTADEIVRAVLSELDAAGYAVVPKEPTSGMMQAAEKPDRTAAMYRDMLAAAPNLPGKS